MPPLPPADDPHGVRGAESGLLTLGFIPLVDCAPLVVARDKGFARAEGLELSLKRETSWANIRDRVTLGHFDAAHMLAPMPIAATLGLARPAVATIAPFSLGLGGNAITLSMELFGAMNDATADQAEAFGRFDPTVTGQALARVIKDRNRRGQEPPTLAIVHPFSSHNYELRYWLSAAGLDPDADVRLTVLPPSRMVEGLAANQIDGFCAGEPWNSLAVETGLGVMAVTKSALWRQGPEKVLGLRADYADRHPDQVAALIRCLYKASRWAELPENRTELATLLAAPAYLDVSPAIIERALQGRPVRIAGRFPETVPDFLVFHRHVANCPWASHALWFYAQMVRWGHVSHAPEHALAARETYRPDLYRKALVSTEADFPRASAKIEGALQHATPVGSRFGHLTLGPDGFFDGRVFDPDELDQYIASLNIPAE